MKNKIYLAFTLSEFPNPDTGKPRKCYKCDKINGVIEELYNTNHPKGRYMADHYNPYTNTSYCGFGNTPSLALEDLLENM